MYIKAKGIQNNPTTGFDAGGLSDTTVLIPLVWNTEKYVHGFISANVADSVTLKIFRQNDYVNFPFQTSQTPTSTTSAENFALRMMLMDKDVFGHTEFEVIDKRLFNYSTVYGDTANAKKFVRFDSSATGNFQSNGSTVNNIMQIVCVTITTQTTTVSGNHCPYPQNQCPNYYTGVPGPCDNCAAVCANVSTTYNTIYHCEIWNEEEGWPSLPGGGSTGGGGNPTGGGGQPPCGSFGANMAEGVVPINCEPGPGGNPWPPVPTQEQLDLQWMQNNVKDSTIDPCITNAITTLKNISPKFPALIRSFFNAVPDFKMTLKKYTNSNWTNLASNSPIPPEAAITTPNYTTNVFNVAINKYYSDCTDLGLASTILHEALHCQLMNWYRLAYFSPDSTNIRISLATNYGYLFPPPLIDANTDSLLRFIINGQNPAQHQDMISRYKNDIANALYQFALAKGINIDLNYCKDLAWMGCFDSKAYLDLPQAEKDRIKDRCFAEKDPYSSLTIIIGNNEYGVNYNNYPEKGHPCH